MYLQTIRLLLATLVLLTLAACKTVGGPSDEEVLTESGAVRLDAEQVKAHVIGKTESWQHGGAYYDEDGSLKAKWLRAYLKGSWEITDDGTLCYELPRWQKRCHFYMQQADKIVLLDEGNNIGERQMYEGNKLNLLDRYSFGAGR